MRTTESLEVSGLQKSFDTKAYAYQGYSGRVRVVEGNPFHDDWAKWSDDGRAKDHNYGDINLRDIK
ncbi:hypothetical protein [Psychrobacter sp. BF1]|uniref:hypothetical protein n=1 Tax=Psychrobacter sp. BF1 TaxID=2821147 RepID=UPI001C4DF7DA|nr:hypothetical protein [Psychrobacter sp. BF1]